MFIDLVSSWCRGRLLILSLDHFLHPIESVLEALLLGNGAHRDLEGLAVVALHESFSVGRLFHKAHGSYKLVLTDSFRLGG